MPGQRFRMKASRVSYGVLCMHLHSGPVRPEDVTPEVWDHVFLDAPAPSSSGISQETLGAMRREFEFWYPWDLRVRAEFPLCQCSRWVS